MFFFSPFHNGWKTLELFQVSVHEDQFVAALRNLHSYGASANQMGDGVEVRRACYKRTSFMFNSSCGLLRISRTSAFAGGGGRGKDGNSRVQEASHLRHRHAHYIFKEVGDTFPRSTVLAGLRNASANVFPKVGFADGLTRRGMGVFRFLVF